MPNIFGPPKGVYGQYLANNTLHSLYTRVKLHMDVHQWIECTLLTENNACLHIFENCANL